MKSGLPAAAAAILARSSSRHVCSDQALRVSIVERFEPYRDRPGGTAVEQLRPGHAEQQQRRTTREQRHMFDQVEEGLLAPLDVVEHDNEWRLLLEQLAKGPADLLRRRPDIRLAQQRTERRRRSRIGRHHVELFDHFDDRPVGDPCPVRQTATPHHPRHDRRQRLRREPRLPDPRITHDRDQLAALLRHRPLPSAREQPELALPTHEQRVMTPLRCSTGREEPKRRHRLRLPLEIQRINRYRVYRALHELVRRLSDQHLARRSRLLEARCDVDRVAGYQPLRRAGHHLTGVHTDPALDAQRRQCLPHLDRRPAGPQRVVLVHHRHTEHRQHRITDELLHRPAMRLDDPAHPLEIAAQQCPQRLRVSLFAKRRRADQVTEQHGDNLPALNRPPASPAPHCAQNRLWSGFS